MAGANGPIVTFKRKSNTLLLFTIRLPYKEAILLPSALCLISKNAKDEAVESNREAEL
jgi:hypothetical protein